jgi:hypothetical protein
MQLQTTLRQPSNNGVSNKLSLLLRLTVDNRIIAVPFEPQVRELLPHPDVERVVQEEVG